MQWVRRPDVRQRDGRRPRSIQVFQSAFVTWVAAKEAAGMPREEPRSKVHYTDEELYEMPFTELIPERLRTKHKAGMRRYLETGVRRIPWTGVELPGLRKDGTEVVLEIAFGEFALGGQFAAHRETSALDEFGNLVENLIRLPPAFQRKEYVRGRKLPRGHAGT